MTTFLLIFRGPCEAGEADNSEDEATDEDIDVSIHWRAVGGFGIMYLVFGVVDLGFGNVYAVHCSVYYIRTLKYIDASIHWTEGIGIEVFLHFVKMWSEQFQKFGIGEVALILFLVSS